MKPEFKTKDQVNAEGKVVDRIVTITKYISQDMSYSVTELKNKVAQMKANIAQHEQSIKDYESDIAELQEIIDQADVKDKEVKD